MKRLILITGELASGKSTLAKSLGKDLGIVVFNKDELKEIECDVFDYSNRDENLKLSEAAMKNMFHILERFAVIGSDLILEANFRTDDIKQIKAIVDKENYQVCLIYLKGHQELLFYRFLERLKNRHKAHISIGLQNDIEKYKEYNKYIESQDTIYTKHIIDMSHMNKDEVLNHVKEILKENKMI